MIRASTRLCRFPCQLIFILLSELACLVVHVTTTYRSHVCTCLTTQSQPVCPADKQRALDHAGAYNGNATQNCTVCMHTATYVHMYGCAHQYMYNMIQAFRWIDVLRNFLCLYCRRHFAQILDIELQRCEKVYRSSWLKCSVPSVPEVGIFDGCLDPAAWARLRKVILVHMYIYIHLYYIYTCLSVFTYVLFIFTKGYQWTGGILVGCTLLRIPTTYKSSSFNRTPARSMVISELCALIYMLSGPAPANQVWLIGRAHVQILHHFLRSAARESLTRSGSRRPSN